MVTLPSEAAHDYELVRHLVSSGMDVARINGAHDCPEAWEQMARNVRKASDEVARPCRISVDLPGPKMRTGPLVEGPRVVRLRPRRDLRGVAVAPARVTLVGGALPRGEGVPALPVDAAWLARRRPLEQIELVDTRGARRHLRVVASGAGRATAEVWDTTYIETGAELDCAGDVTSVGAVPAQPQYHVLCPGDGLCLTVDLAPAEPWSHGQSGTARIGCTLPAAFEAARTGPSCRAGRREGGGRRRAGPPRRDRPAHRDGLVPWLEAACREGDQHPRGGPSHRCRDRRGSAASPRGGGPCRHGGHFVPPSRARRGHDAGLPSLGGSVGNSAWSSRSRRVPRSAACPRSCCTRCAHPWWV